MKLIGVVVALLPSVLSFSETGTPISISENFSPNTQSSILPRTSQCYTSFDQTFCNQLYDVFLYEHNFYRDKHFDTPCMVQDADLNRGAQAWAQYLADEGKFEHASYDEREQAGENIFRATRTSSVSDSAIEGIVRTAVELWYNEIADWNFETHSSNGGITGHFTQIVWTSSTNLGLGVSVRVEENPSRTYVYVVGRYRSHGNFNGQYAEKVKPLCGESCTGTCANSPTETPETVAPETDSPETDVPQTGSPDQGSGAGREWGSFLAFKIPINTPPTPMFLSDYPHPKNECTFTIV